MTLLAKRASPSYRIGEEMIRHANEVDSNWCDVLKLCISVISAMLRFAHLVKSQVRIIMEITLVL